MNVQNSIQAGTHSRYSLRESSIRFRLFPEEGPLFTCTWYGAVDHTVVRITAVPREAVFHVRLWREEPNVISTSNSDPEMNPL